MNGTCDQCQTATRADLCHMVTLRLYMSILILIYNNTKWLVLIGIIVSKKVQMEWKFYNIKIVHCFYVKLCRWPEDVLFDVALLDEDQIIRVKNNIANRTCVWVHLDHSEIEALEASPSLCHTCYKRGKQTKAPTVPSKCARVISNSDVELSSVSLSSSSLSPLISEIE